jgi:RimJ/RimL family protein N-acetyltransferase
LERIRLERLFVERFVLERFVLERIRLERIELERIQLELRRMGRLVLERFVLERLVLERLVLERLVLERLELELRRTMTTATDLDLRNLELHAIASQPVHPEAPGPARDECGGWACERLGLPGACEATRQTPLIGYEATELFGLQHHHICWMLTLLADPTIAHYEPLPVPPSDPQAADILATFIDRLTPARPSAQGWMVLEAGQQVGVCQLRRTGPGHLVGVSLRAEARNRGLGTALFTALSDWGLGDGSFVAGEVEDDNLPSHNALQSAGYTPNDRYAIVLADGRPTTVTRYENFEHGRGPRL